MDLFWIKTIKKSIELEESEFQAQNQNQTQKLMMKHKMKPKKRKIFMIKIIQEDQVKSLRT